ncbi:MAG: hypothetical protein CL933_23905 [Deltaproteobacteria bacterium]|nr:hypothetical protein [Deltaproteobacteria bacterium]
MPNSVSLGRSIEKEFCSESQDAELGNQTTHGDDFSSQCKEAENSSRWIGSAGARAAVLFVDELE